MKTLYLIIVLVGVKATSATLDYDKINKIKSTAAEKLHTLTEKAAAGLQQFKETASNSIHELTERATHNLQHLGDDIDLNNLYKLDVLEVIPTLKKKYELIKDVYNRPETKVNVIHVLGDDLHTHFDHAKVVKVKEWHPALPHHYHAPPHRHHHESLIHHHEPHHHHHHESLIHHHEPHHHHEDHHHHHLEHYHVRPLPLTRFHDIHD
ncbi:hypothetical protein ACJJTC_007350 [Scirpophaga incertulas]